MARSPARSEPFRSSEKIRDAAPGFVAEALARDLEGFYPVDPKHSESELSFAPSPERPGSADVAQAKGAYPPCNDRAIALGVAERSEERRVGKECA